mmetsp:Transcript_954/g.2164  ORF Transcript_954/g.2164 Transcript_954/m.2164 type:complete len:90 (-) Transcript_954:159-428(-)
MSPWHDPVRMSTTFSKTSHDIVRRCGRILCFNLSAKHNGAIDKQLSNVDVCLRMSIDPPQQPTVATASMRRPTDQTRSEHHPSPAVAVV